MLILTTLVECRLLKFIYLQLLKCFDKHVKNDISMGQFVADDITKDDKSCG